MHQRKRSGHAVATALLFAGLAGCGPQPKPLTFLTEPASPPTFNFLTECPAGNMDACRAKIDAFGVGFGTERDRRPALGSVNQRVLIIAFQGTKSVSASTPPADPTLILHLSNHGHVKTAMYNLDPSSLAEYYVTVQNASGAAQWTLWRVPTANSGSVTSVATGLYSLCQPPSTSPWAYSIADFATCANAPHLQQGAVQHASLGADLFRPFTALISLLQPAIDDPGWFSCDGGCCSMSSAS